MSGMFSWVALVQILIIMVMLALFYRSFIRNTSSERLVRGLLGLALLWAVSFILIWLHLDLLGTFLHWTALFLSISLIVVFQPELRKFMALMGNIDEWRRLFHWQPHSVFHSALTAI